MRVIGFNDTNDYDREGGRAHCWTQGVTIEDAALEQIGRLARMPFTYKHVAVMPDVHVGIGATVGTVFASESVLIPAAVGVDIGCGMVAVKLDLDATDLPDNLFGVRSAIEAAVPHGRTDNGGPNDRGAWGEPPAAVLDVAKHLSDIRPLFGCRYDIDHPRFANQLGTLGSGNHFIELCLDEHQRVWLMLHSGSRGMGNRIASKFISLAKKDMERWHIQLSDADLAYLPQGADHFTPYVAMVRWAQEYACLNRRLMVHSALRAVLHALGLSPEALILDPTGIAVNCHHNYVSREKHFGKEVWVTRKGAVSAREGELGIIPGSMGTKSYIVRGRGNRESFHSCSHGAGRRGSRRWARVNFSLEDHVRATEGVECRKDLDVLDETPGAYKDIDAVMAAQADLVEVVHTLKQVLCVKG